MTARALLALLSLLLVAGCSANTSLVNVQGSAGQGGSVSEAVVGTARTLNPLFEQEDNARDIDSLIYQGLTTIGQDQQVVPLLAAKLTVSDDRLTYTVDLKRGVRWADGQPFGVDDVLFTYSVLQSPDYRVSSGTDWKNIKIEPAGPNAVRFTLKAPSAPFPLALRQGIIAKHVFEKVAVADIPGDPHSGEKAFGTGPFKVDAISKDRRLVTLGRNPQAKPAPFLDQFQFRGYPSLGDALDAVARGEADSAGALQPPNLGALANRPDLALHEGRTFTFVAMFFNLSQDQAASLDPAALRQGLAKAVDRQQIVGQQLDGRAEVASGPIPPSNWGYSAAAAKRLDYDPQGAEKLLDAAGWPKDPATHLRMKDGRPLKLTLKTSDGFPYRQVADALAAQYKAVGVQLEIEPVSASALVSDLRSKQYQVALGAIDNGPDPDQTFFWHSDPTVDGVNFAGPLMLRQALIDKDLEDGRAGVDRKARKQAYDDFQQLMADAAPAVFLFEPHYAYLQNKRVRGFRINPAIDPVDRFQFAASWYVNSKAA
ncbi:MAG: peptide ABC transporter substrate-binding protein [Candidatus Dormibacteraeota bacterium]|uniref:ABC transporter substrate-binding protein n=1 Tax=Candidatus Dormibacter sp. TaxID=2973982 RepID=UPI0026C3D388|nr:peptide ABC transporter substrate-binding protein [Candidatus Dormibacteraeota bacterium]